MVFLVVMYGCESWTIKKAECWRMGAFELWYWRRLWRVPWTRRRSNHSILRKSVLNIHWKDWCGRSNILATWCKELTRSDPDTGKDWRQEEKGTTEDGMVGRHHQLDGNESEQAVGIGNEQRHLAVHGVAKSQTWLTNWTELSWSTLPIWYYLHVHLISLKKQTIIIIKKKGIVSEYEMYHLWLCSQYPVNWNKQLT